MNSGMPETHPSIKFYDSDYPSKDLSPYPDNFDETTKLQGLYRDVERFVELAKATGGPILELCCGTGRVAIPLARAGFAVTAVDDSTGMLAQFRTKLGAESRDIQSRVTIVQQDVTKLSLDQKRFGLAIFPFNSLMCIPSAAAQGDALVMAAKHMKPDARLVLDLVNPFVLDLQGSVAPKPFFTRRNVHNGMTYTRFAAMGPIGTDQVQELYGWYDEITPDSSVRRYSYSMNWRVLFPNEIELMLDSAQLTLERFEGDHECGPFTTKSPKMNVIAKKKSM